MLRRNGAAPRRGAPLLPALRLLAAKRPDQLLLERALGMGVDRRVAGLVADASFRILGVHTRQSAGDLLGRPLPVAQPVQDVAVQPSALNQLGGTATPSPSSSVLLSALRRAVRGLGRGRMPARQLSGHRRRTAPEKTADRPRTAATAAPTQDDGALLITEVLLSGIHRNILPRSGCGCCA